MRTAKLRIQLGLYSFKMYPSKSPPKGETLTATQARLLDGVIGGYQTVDNEIVSYQIPLPPF